MRFKKGSPEARRYMAKIRAKKGTASLGALPFTGVFDTIKFKAETVEDGILFTVGDKKITYKRGNTVTEIGEKIANAIKSQNTDYFYTDSEFNALKRKFSKFAGTLKDQLPKKSTMPKKTAVKSKPVTAKVVATSTQRGKSNIKRDAMLKALPPGKRISKTGRKYTETRKNRSDAPGSLLGIKKAMLGAFFDDNSIKELDQLKKEYYKLAKKYHPDAGGTKEQFQQLQAEYEKQRDRILKGSNFTYDQKANEINIDNALKDVIDVLVSISGIDIEVIGKWIWVSGNTFPIKTQLKNAGLIFIKKDGKPYWIYKGIESAGRGKMSMEEIKSKYGSQKISPKEFKKISGIGYMPVRVPLVKKNKLLRSLKKLTKAIDKRPV